MLNVMLSTSPLRFAVPLLVFAAPVLVAAAGTVFAGCKSGGSSGGSAVSSANLFERQPKRGELSFVIRSNGQMGQTVGDVQVGFTETLTNDAGSYANLDGGSPPDCEPVAIGPCVVISCVQGTPIGGGESRGVAPAGDITITDATSGKSQSFTASSGGYQSNGQSAIPANPGDTVTFSAAGGDAPPFTQTLVAPLPITPAPIPCPDASADAGPGSCPISRSQDLAVGWSGGDHGTVIVSLSAFGAGCNNAQSCPPLQSTAVCRFDVGTGGGSIPKGVLARFPETGVQIGYSVADSLDFLEGDYIIRASAITATQTQQQPAFPLTQ